MTDTTSQAVVETPAPDATATVTPDASADPSPAAVDTSESPAPRKSGEQKRIDELTWHRRNAERRSRAVEAENAELRAQLASRQAQPEPQSIPASAPKKLADFNYDEDQFSAYLIEHAAEKAADKAEARLRDKQEQDKQKSTRKDHETKFRASEAKLREEIEDYEDVAYTAPIRDHVAEIVMGMDEGPRIAYYLGKHPETAAQLSALSPLEAAKELGRIETRLAYEREQAKAKPVSKAPPPPPTIEATEPAVSKDPSEMTDAEFAKWRKRQIAQRRN